ncbi:MAG: hypothetical protein R3D62_02080 [Xanthobacteraceae bacterium]
MSGIVAEQVLLSYQANNSWIVCKIRFRAGAVVCDGANEENAAEAIHSGEFIAATPNALPDKPFGERRHSPAKECISRKRDR